MDDQAPKDETAVLRATVARLEDELGRARTQQLTANSVLETIPAVVLRVSLDLKIEFVNRVLPEYRGATLIGEPVFAFAPPDQHQAMRQALEAAIATRRPTTYETVAQAPDGTRDWYFTTVGPVVDGGVVTGLTLISTNISHAKQVETELSESRARLEIALDAGGVGVWRWDAVQDRIEWDDRLCRMFGLAQANAPRTRADFVSLVPVAHRARLEAHIDSALETGVYPDFDLPVGAGSGARWFIIKGGPVRDLGGAVVGLMGGVLDVTDLRLLEEQVRQTQKLEAVGQLSAGIAHNFNNMLATIVPTLELARRRLEDRDKVFVESALMSALQASRLIKQLMAFSQRAAGARGATEPLDAVIARAVTLCEQTFEQRVHIVLGDIEASRGVPVDGAQTEQALVNLLVNARDAVESLEADRRTVMVRVEAVAQASMRQAHEPAQGDYVALRVEDRGPGIEPEVGLRIFEPFFTTKPLGKGTGLGLSTAWAAAKAQGGFLDFVSVPGAGTTFTLLLPRSGAADPDAAGRTPSQSPPRNALVLVIDDHPNVLLSTVKLLEVLGFRPVGAQSGEEGVQLARQQRFDVALVDYSMPGQSPQATLAQLREIDPGLPLISFSGLGRRLEGATAHLTKPATGEQLERALNEALAQRKTPRPG